MNRDEQNMIYAGFATTYVILAAYNYAVGSQWMWDAIMSVVLLTLVFFLNKYLKIGKTGFLLLNGALIVHNLGTFGFYEFSWGIIAYDNIVHFMGSMIAAYILFNYVARKFHRTKKEKLRTSVMDEHLIVTFFLVIASVAMLGTAVEVIEFFGWEYLGPGDGIFFVGSGDGGYVDSDYATQYEDTMQDIIVNLIGSGIGALLYYHLKYKKKIWMKKAI